MTVSAFTKTSKNLKLQIFLNPALYVRRLNTFHLLKTEDVTQRVETLLGMTVEIAKISISKQLVKE